MKEELVQSWNNMSKEDLVTEIETIYGKFDDPRQITFTSATSNLSPSQLRTRLLKWLRDYPLSFLSLDADEDSEDENMD